MMVGADNAGTAYSNSSIQSKSEIRTITLSKSETSGFGFNIVGGTDGPYIPGHDGIFICQVRRPEIDDLIKIGDRIISVNGMSLESITHDKAVELLKEQRGLCEFKIEANAERAIAASFDTTPESSTTMTGHIDAKNSPSIQPPNLAEQIVPTGLKLVIYGGIIAATAWMAYRLAAKIVHKLEAGRR